MKDTIYLIVARNGVQGYRKSPVAVSRGEALVKINIEMPTDAFTPPTLEQTVVINSWSNGIDMEDVQFNNNIITEEEASLVRVKRVEKMKTILESQGYTITKEEEEN